MTPAVSLQIVGLREWSLEQIFSVSSHTKFHFKKTSVTEFCTYIWHFGPFQNKYFLTTGEKNKQMLTSGGILEHSQNKESDFVYT